MSRLVDIKKGAEWKITKRGDKEVCDTAEQYLFVARILVKAVGVDDVRKMQQDHVIQFRSAVQKLPRSYGKSPKDWSFTIEEAIANAKGANLRLGRQERTIEKNLTYLRSFVRMLKAGVGVAIDPGAIAALKPKGALKQKANTLRSALKISGAP